MFRDITPLLLVPAVFKLPIDEFVQRDRDQQVTLVAGLDGRGFIIGSALAYALGIGFVPIRKRTMRAGKRLLERLGAHVIERAAVIDLPELKGADLLLDDGWPVFCLVFFQGH